ncbi:MAG: general secretion pathway protein GspK, partial [Planctomycetia bacterium]|nr:general secretion pathway protein GspK [Planctomycetia bacterium]
GIRYGLEDESTRLNLNVLLIVDQQLPGSGRTLLMALPGMTEDVADAILDWLDPDDTARDAGAEVDYYSGLSPPYAPKNGPVDTVEELLLVRGVTPQLLFGVDINHNYQLDRYEQAEENTAGASTDPNAFRGWAAYLTIYSVEWNITPEGNPKVYLNTADLNKLVEDMQAASFPQDWMNFIVAYRQMGPSQSTTTVIGTNNTAAASNTLGGTATTQPTGDLNMDLPAQTPIGGILDLIGAQVQYTFAGAPAPSTLNSPFTADGLATYLPQLMDYCTVNPAATIPGRININQCSAMALAGIPGMTSDISSKILTQRTVDLANADPSRRYETWILTENIVTLDQMKVLMPFICGSGAAYRCQVVGFFQDGKAYSRAECVFDATSPLPRILLWRDLTHLGRGYSMEMLGANFSR